MFGTMVSLWSELRWVDFRVSLRFVRQAATFLKIDTPWFFCDNSSNYQSISFIFGANNGDLLPHAGWLFSGCLSVRLSVWNTFMKRDTPSFAWDNSYKYRCIYSCLLRCQLGLSKMGSFLGCLSVCLSVLNRFSSCFHTVMPLATTKLLCFDHIKICFKHFSLISTGLLFKFGTIALHENTFVRLAVN